MIHQRLRYPRRCSSFHLSRTSNPKRIIKIPQPSIQTHKHFGKSQGIAQLALNEDPQAQTQSKTSIGSPNLLNQHQMHPITSNIASTSQKEAIDTHIDHI